MYNPEKNIFISNGRTYTKAKSHVSSRRNDRIVTVTYLKFVDLPCDTIVFLYQRPIKVYEPYYVF